MRIIVEGVTEVFAEKLVALAVRHDAELSVTTVDTGWSVDRAECYLRSLTAGARRFAEMVVVDGNGYIDADRLRSVLGRLNGPSNALTRAVPRGVREGWWPQGIKQPVTSVYDPDNPSWHKNIAYRMDRENVPVFQEAFLRIAQAAASSQSLGNEGEQPAGPVWGEGDVPSAFGPAPGWGDADDAPRALAFDAGSPRGEEDQPAAVWAGDAPSGLDLPPGWDDADDAPRALDPDAGPDYRDFPDGNGR